MSFEFGGYYRETPSRRFLLFKIDGYDFALVVHRTGDAAFEFLVISMPSCPDRPFNDIVTNTFVRGDLRYILFSPTLMPADWDEAEVFAKNWAQLVVRYIGGGPPFHLSRASDEFGPRLKPHED